MNGSGRAEPRGKRAFDVTIALVAGFLLAPVAAWAAWRIRRDLGTPVLFWQARLGKDGEVFEMVKFRTMRDIADPTTGELISDDQRLTEFGRFLRRTSIDEIPELWNVLKGEMSIVGPRPLLAEYRNHYTPRQMRRHEVRPGITGLAQISGRNSVDWETRFEIDIDYVDRISIWLDISIIARTLRKVINSEGVSGKRGETMERFDREIGLHE